MLQAFFVAHIGSSAAPLAKPVQRYLWRPLSGTELLDLPATDNILPFCFPAGVDGITPKEYAASESYIFTLTAGDGSRLHGFCRRFLPPRTPTAALRLPVVACLITPTMWVDFMHKVMEALEGLLIAGGVDVAPTSPQAMPLSHPAANFLNTYAAQLASAPVLGPVLRVPLPDTAPLVRISPMPGAYALSGHDAAHFGSLQDDASLVLVCPHDTQGDAHAAAAPLAPLLWHVPPDALASLLAALLLERRVIVAGHDLDRLSRVVHAAAALLYPFSWHHIFLPILPAPLLEYLSSPIPYLIGLPAQFLPRLRTLPLEEVVVVDLDLRTCVPAPGSPGDDGLLLPFRRRLIESLELLHAELRSPTEQESTPSITALFQEFFLRLVGAYRESVVVEGVGQPGTDLGGDDVISANGLVFDVGHLINQQRSERQRNFLRLFRHSQMFHMWALERLQLAAVAFDTEDTFERKVSTLGPGGRRVSPHMRALSKKLPRQVTTAASRGVTAVNTVLARGSGWKERLGQQLREANIKERAQQTFKSLREDIQPRLAAQLHKISTSSPFQRTSSNGSMGVDGEGVAHSDAPAGPTLWEREGAHRDEKQGEQRGEASPFNMQGQPAEGVVPRPLIALGDEEEDDDAGAGDGGALYHRRLEQAQRVQEARRAVAVPDLLTGDAYVATSPPSTTNWAMWDVVRDPWAEPVAEESSVVRDDPWAALPAEEKSVETQLDSLLL